MKKSPCVKKEGMAEYVGKAEMHTHRINKNKGKINNKYIIPNPPQKRERLNLDALREKNSFVFIQHPFQVYEHQLSRYINSACIH